MTIMKFKTNVKCQGCVDRIAELFTKNKEISSWEVDLTSDDKILTVETSLSVSEIRGMLGAIGYIAEII
ncbi:heavy metal transport/detoxification protein [Candidatus Gracilibacteria bacterium HOT-871]|nr:heavy metal transport/detoxification protein [Candidatus Gracilibacteria bacterium HOT-871]RKW24410.1 MAG: heavy-metal-associated domain-containing protein [Candidatus Gracilibacteria bacterium]